VANHSDTCDRWAREVGKPNSRYVKGRSIYVRDNKIYSWGSHFEMARLVGTREKGFFLINGDSYSNSTTTHQGYVRDAIRSQGIPSIIVPYSALERAEIDKDSIRPLEIREDGSENIPHSLTIPADAFPALRTIIYSMSADTIVDTAAIAGKKIQRRIRFKEYRSPQYGYDHSGNWTMIEPRGMVTLETPRVSFYEISASGQESYLGQFGNGAKENPDGSVTLNWTTYRHILGASLFTAAYKRGRTTVVERRWQSDDREGNWPLDADSRRYRQEWDTDVRCFRTQVEYYRDESKTVRGKFLSDFDENEPWPLYFLCELPRDNGKARTIADALESLKPGIVLANVGKEIKRQGDMFFIPMSELEKVKPIPFRYPDKNERIHGTNHIARESVKVHGIGTFVRGKIEHDSARRSWNGRILSRDHKTIKLDTWHLAIKNRVPERENSRGVIEQRAWSIEGRVD
jgi:hypothetical protein